MTVVSTTPDVSKTPTTSDGNNDQKKPQYDDKAYKAAWFKNLSQEQRDERNRRNREAYQLNKEERKKQQREAYRLKKDAEKKEIGKKDDASERKAKPSQLKETKEVQKERKTISPQMTSLFQLDCTNINIKYGKKLGDGGAATVKQISLNNKPFAGKMMEKNMTDEQRITFLREIENLAKLNHHNIIPFFGFFETTKEMCLVLELAQSTVAARLQSEGIYSEAHAAILIAQLCDALSYAHRLNILHRDVKPSNLLLVTEEWLKLSDFGASTYRSNKKHCTNVGTSGFKSPEIMKGKAQTDKTDVWSVGVTLMAMTTTTWPFKTEEDLMKGRYCVPKALSRSTQEVIGQMLKVNPASRPSAAEILGSPWTMHYKEEYWRLKTKEVIVGLTKKHQ